MNMNMNTNQNPAPLTVECDITLTEAAKKAILISQQRIAQTNETVKLPLDPAYIDRLNIKADKITAPITWPACKFDAMPLTLAEYFKVFDAHLAAVRQKNEAEQQASRDAEAQRIAESKPYVDDLIAKLTAQIAADLPADAQKIGMYPPYGGPDNTRLTLSADDQRQYDDLCHRYNARIDERDRAAKAAAAAAAAAAADQEQQQYGGTVYPLDAGYTGFAGRGNWLKGQSKRWVGVFTDSRGIASFLDSPRGEFSFDAQLLRRGDCIQMGGFDTNSRGRRRNESEAFGVVVAIDAEKIVVDHHDSRAACFAAAAKLRAADQATKSQPAEQSDEPTAPEYEGGYRDQREEDEVNADTEEMIDEILSGR